MIGQNETMTRRSGWLVPVLSALVVIDLGIALLDIICGPWNHDGGFYLLKASYVADGLRPYINYETIYTPLLDTLDAIPLLLGISRLAVVVILPIAWIAANSFASALLVYSYTEDITLALVAAAAFPLFAVQNDGNHLTLEYGVSFFSAIALTAVSPSVRSKRWAIFVAGGATALAALSKQNGALVVLPVAIAIAFGRERRAVRGFAEFIAGAALPILATLAWVGFDFIAIKRNLFDVFFNDYVSKSAPSLTAWLADVFERPTTLYLFVGALGASAFVTARARTAGEKFFAASTGACVVIQFAPRLVRNYAHYDINVWPAAIVAIALLVAAWPDARRRSAALALAVFVFAATAHFATPSAAARWHEQNDLFELYYPTAQALAHMTPLSTRVRQYGSEPVIEYLANRTPELLTPPYAKVPRIHDGRGIYDDWPPKQNAVIIVDRGQPWVTAIRRKVEAEGFVIAYRAGRGQGDRRVTAEILLHPYLLHSAALNAQSGQAVH